MPARSRAMPPIEACACSFNHGDPAALAKNADIGTSMTHRLLLAPVCPCPLQMPRQVLPTGLSRVVAAKAKDARHRAHRPRPCLRDSAAGLPRRSRDP